ncbi:hypothetical protein [Paenibacillus sp. P32E]|uniref:hypothetical protein n=1 Tax=Paenibacillus sp. P32E TaxID=1349434 RepID=UPI00093A027B|nr:hypothetical protein [Paenibacillus sp. P32E]OKP91323.1 hypothetical protein A3848_09450 [Paenibacillus sp. P32E]
MDFVELRRKHIAWNISQNPSSISIHRKGKRRKGGGYEEFQEDLPPVTVRIFVGGNAQSPKMDSGTIGTVKTDEAYNLLADEFANLQAGTEVTDTFIHIGDTFKILQVMPYVVKGVIVGYRADLERMK